MAKKKNKHGSLAVIASLAAAGALGAYFLYGQEGAKRRAKVRGWVLKAKGEVLDNVENLKEVNQDRYHRIVDRVMSRYRKIKSIDNRDVEKLANELKRHWSNIEKEFKVAGRQTKRVAKRKKKAVKKSLK